MGYAVAIEKDECNYAAHVPDLPSCVATGATLDKARAEIREAIAFPLAGPLEDGRSRSCSARS